MPRQQRTFARKISGKHYRILAYRDSTSGRWRQKSQGSVTRQEAWQINEDWRLQQKADDLPEEPQELVAAYLEAVGDLGLMLGAIGDRLPDDIQGGFAGAVAAFDQGHDQIVDAVISNEDEHLYGQVGRSVKVAQRTYKREVDMAGDVETITETSELPDTEVTWDAVRDLVEGYNRMSRGLDSLAKIAGDGYLPVTKMQELATEVFAEMGKLSGFVEMEALTPDHLQVT